MLARQLGYPLVLAHALFFEAFGHWRRRDVTAQRESAAHTIALSEAHGHPLYLGVGRALHAAARVAAGELEATVDVLAAVAFIAGTGMQGNAPVFFALLREAYLTAGQLIEARGAVETGLALGAQAGHCWDSELHRLQSEPVLKAGGSTAEAEEFLPPRDRNRARS